MNEPEQFRQYLQQRDQRADRDDKTLQAAIDGAKDWVAVHPIHGGAFSVAANYLTDGIYHP